jgi:hypothetical protein
MLWYPCHHVHLPTAMTQNRKNSKRDRVHPCHHVHLPTAMTQNRKNSKRADCRIAHQVIIWKGIKFIFLLLWFK